MKLLSNKYVKFGIAVTLYLLWVLWVWNAWLLLGIPIIYDIYVSKKVNWTPWKKREGKNSTVVEWIDALIFAVLAVTFINIFFFQNYKIPTGSMEKTLLIGDHLYVSKLKYGPKIPNTPLSFPFTQHTLFGGKSYLEWIQWPYKRLAGFTHIKNDNIVVFNFPEGDTVLVREQTQSYYSHIREQAKYYMEQDKMRGATPKSMSEYETAARKYFWDNEEIVVRPVDRRDNYIKRCVAIPGDTLTIVDGQIYINSKPQKFHEDVQFKYLIKTKGILLDLWFQKNNIYKDEVESSAQDSLYLAPLTEKKYQALKALPGIVSVIRQINPKGQYEDRIFPHSPRYPWNEDNFGPLVMPKKGVTVPLNMDNLCIYQRIICPYEGNKLEVKNNQIYINGKIATSYTFKMDYYFMIGDNRHNSADSRFWGFVPEDHIVGAPKFVWLSLDKEKSFPANIRWSRMFTWADKE